MDIPRERKNQRVKRWAIGGAVLAVLVLATAALARLEPAAPSVDRAGIWVDTVREGTMVRQVRGPGTLVPEQIRYISAVSGGRVEQIMVEPGTSVTPDTELLVLSNPEVTLQAMEAQRDLAGSRATVATLRATLENERLNQEAAAATVRSEYREAQRQVTANRELAERGLIPTLDLRRSEDTAAELAERLEIEEQRLEFLAASMEAQLEAQLAEVERLVSLSALQESYVEALVVNPGATGVLRELPLQEGEWVNPGTRVAVVVQPGRLKAELRVPETQARDVAVGQPASIDTRNGLIPGRVVRIDPAVENGTVTVDVALEGELPRGARPDLSVDGTIEIERLENVVYTGRPAYGQAESTVGLFRLDPEGRTANRIGVQLGRSSVNTIEVVNGLQPGDVVILSDMSQWDAVDRVRLR
ncbi:MAG: HlyD family efflux transporter periplasmic adaptor subunit [Gemmatimonas sp.]|nr:HlyD family efflux transporter periplasmic adaptor subunit [Gemmatimonas sp.]